MDQKKITLTPEGANALREFADAIPQAVQNIVEDTEKLNRVYQAESETLGIHEVDFSNLIQSIKEAQKTASEAIEKLPGMLRNTANRIDEYVAAHPSIDSGK